MPHRCGTLINVFKTELYNELRCTLIRDQKTLKGLLERKQDEKYRPIMKAIHNTSNKRLN